jgi:hypothetical protein
MAYLGQVGLLAATYFSAAKLSLLLAIPPGYATAVWPPSGMALAAILFLGNRFWPGIWFGAALANFTINSSFFAAVLIGSGHAGSARPRCSAFISAPTVSSAGRMSSHSLRLARQRHGRRHRCAARSG